MSTAKLVPFNFYTLDAHQINSMLETISLAGLKKLLVSFNASPELLWDGKTPESIEAKALTDAVSDAIDELADDNLSTQDVKAGTNDYYHNDLFFPTYASLKICGELTSFSNVLKETNVQLSDQAIENIISGVVALWDDESVAKARQALFKSRCKPTDILSPKSKKGVTSLDAASWEPVVEAIMAKREDKAVTADITASTLLNVLALCYGNDAAWYDFEYFLHHEVVVQDESDLDTGGGISRDNLIPLYMHQKFTQYLQAYVIFCLFPRKYAEETGLGTHYDEFVALLTSDEEGEDLNLGEFETDYDEESDQTGFSDYQYVKPLDWTTRDNNDAPPSRVDGSTRYPKPGYTLEVKPEDDSDSDDDEATPEPDDSSDAVDDSSDDDSDS